MAFNDLDVTLFGGGVKELPIGGKKYQFPGTISARTGLLLHRMLQQAAAARDSLESGESVDLNVDLFEGLPEGEDDVRSELLGDAEFELIEDGVPLAVVDHVFSTLMFWHINGPEAAEQIWAAVPGTVVQGEVVTPKAPQDRRGKSPRGTSVSATSTQRRASSTRTARSTPTTRSGGANSSTTGA